MRFEQYDLYVTIYLPGIDINFLHYQFEMINDILNQDNADFNISNKSIEGDDDHDKTITPS